jgi:hypothetical protein
MNKVILSAVVACGLLLLDSPEATAHEGTIRQHRSHSYDYSDKYRRDSYRRDSYSRDGYRRNHYNANYNRAKKMPRRLKHNKSFRRWYDSTRLSRNRHLSWDQLFDIYYWERRYFRSGRY